jgi:hypothetical protein
MWAVWVGCAPDRGLLHDGYVWQRVWSDPVREGVAAAALELDGLRVNAASVGADGVVVHDVDLRALAAARRPIRPVARWDADVPVDGDQLGTLLASLAERWRAAGVEVAGVEVDHDQGTAGLADYARALRVARERLPADLRLSITALPTWSTSADLAGVTDAVDQVVLQVHAVDPPRLGLFDPARASAAVDAYAARTDDLWVAVPAYGRALSSGAQLRVDPADVVGFLDGLDPREVRGVVWFRVPLPGEAEVWPLGAIALADDGVVARGRVEARVRPSGPGLYDLELANDGLAWVPLPARVEVQGPCTLADAVGGYEVDRSDGLAFVRAHAGPLDPGDPVALGRARCASTPSVELP